VLEAAGQQYQYNGRISTNTGRPAVGGWLFHEWGWRPGFETERDERTTTVQTIYETPDPALALELMRPYQVRYVVVGDLERSTYAGQEEGKFLAFSKLIGRWGDTALYQVDLNAHPRHERAGSPRKVPGNPWQELRKLRLEESQQPTSATSATTLSVTFLDEGRTPGQQTSAPLQSSEPRQEESSAPLSW
jgi:hypothetical protein